MVKKLLTTLLLALTLAVTPLTALALRTDGVWDNFGTYMKTTQPSGLDILINGFNHYLNWGSVSGTNGYGLRDFGGIIQYKNSAGAWSGFSSGGSGGAWSTTTSTVLGQLVNYPNNNTDVVSIGVNSTTSSNYYIDPNIVDAFFKNLRITNSSTTNATSSSFAITNLLSQLLSTNANGSVIATTVSAPFTFLSNVLGCTNASSGVTGCLTGTDWNTFNGKQAALTFTAPLSNTANVVTWFGLATTSQPASSNILVSNGSNGVYGVATSTLTPSSPLTGSLTQIGSGGALGCTTASSGVAGCLSNTSFDTFNNKQNALTAIWPEILTGSTLSFGWATTSQPASSNVYVSNGTNGFYGVATSTETGNNGLTGSFTVLGSSGNIGLATINAGVLGAITNGAVPTSQATSTLYGVGIGGQVLAWLNGVPTWGATTTFTNDGKITTAYGANNTWTVGCVTCLTGNQSITLSGAITGSGATAITTAFGSTATANSVLANNTGGSAVPAFVATSSLYLGSAGQVLAFLNNAWVGVATTTFSGTAPIGTSFANGVVTVTCATCSTFTYPFITGTNFGALVNATNTIWMQQGLQASSTSQFVNVQNYGSTSLQNFTGVNATTSNATTSSLAVTNVTSALMLTNGTGSVVPFVASAACSNQFMRAISAVGASTCASVANTDLVSSAITINGTSVSLGGTITVASTTLLANNNTWSGFNTFGASTTLQNYTALNATTSQATTTQFYATLSNVITASSSVATTSQLFLPIQSALLKTLATGQVTNATNGTDFSLISALSCSAGNHLATVAANGTFTCTADTGSGGGDSFTHPTAFGTTTSATTTSLWTKVGLFASTTFMFDNATGTQATTTNRWCLFCFGDLTQSRTFTATGTGVGNQSSFQNFTFVNATGTQATTTNEYSFNTFGDLGQFRTLTATGTGVLNQSLFQNFTFVNATGTNATATGAFFSPLGSFSFLTVGTSTASTTIYGNSTSTFSGGVKAPCFSVDGGVSCITSGSATAIGGSGAVQFANGAAFNGDTKFFWDNTAKALAIGTSTAYAKLSLQGSYGLTQPLFDIATSTISNGSATSSLFRVNYDGNIGMGTSSPFARLSIMSTLGASSGLLGSLTPLFAIASSSAGLATSTPFIVDYLGNLSLTGGSTTLRNFTFVNATGTQATSTSLYVSGIFRNVDGAFTGVNSPIRRVALMVGTTTSWAGTTTGAYVPSATMTFAGTVQRSICTASTTGAFLNIAPYINITAMTPNSFIASTTKGTITYTGGNTFVSGDTLSMYVGTSTASQVANQSVSCTFDLTQTQ